MATIPVFHLALRTERDVVQARQRAREVAAELGLDNQDQIRMATAASEIARNAFRYARNGKVAFAVGLEEPQYLEVTVSDTGPGIPNLEEILDGRYRSTTGMGIGLLGTRRLMDRFEIDSQPAGTTVRMVKHIPLQHAMMTQGSVRELNRRMEQRTPESPYEEIEQQNQELLKTLQELRPARRNWSCSIASWRIPIAAWSPCTRNWTSAPTISAVPPNSKRNSSPMSPTNSARP